MLTCCARALAAVVALAIGGGIAGDGLRAQVDLTDRLGKLRTWLEAAERHQPGIADSSLGAVRTWDRGELVRTALHLDTLLALMWNPRASSRSIEIRLRHGDPIPYSPREREQLRRIARDAASRSDVNEIRRRGGMLHTNIAMLERLQRLSAGTSPEARHPRSDPRDPARDLFVLAWYHAVGAFMLQTGHLSMPHFSRVLELFPSDAELLLLAGSLHERLATPRVQDALRDATAADDADARRLAERSSSVKSERDELRLAESMFRRALEAAPGLVEARLRLGAVLVRLERHGEALPELRAAISSTDDSLLRYYGSLLLGRAAESRGDGNTARQAYEAAASLYPDAQSPQLALSRLTFRSGNRTSALGAIEQTLQRTGGGDVNGDPWWTYSRAAARLLDTVLTDRHSTLQPGDPRSTEPIRAASAPSERITRIQTWMALVEQHEPGNGDDATDQIRSWPRAEMQQVRVDLRTLLHLMRDPNATLFYPDPDPRDPGRTPVPIFYSAAELNALRELARDAGLRGDQNRVVKRGALLHTTAAILAPVESAGGGRQSNPAEPHTLFFADGRQRRVEEIDGHWEMARALLELVTPNPARNDRPDPAGDEMVRAWYRATVAFMLAQQRLVLPHFDRALELFPDDPDVLFLVGSVHALLSAPTVQDVMRSARLPAGVTFNVRSERDELRRAEALLRRAVDTSPQHVEARLRLAYVLVRLGRHADALEQLDAAPRIEDPLLRYYASLFTGRAAEALGDLGRARRSYEEAATLYPLAQSPHLALSQLAERAGRREAAVDALDRVLSMSDDAAAEDPWWTYHPAAGREADLLLAEMFALAPGRR